MNRWQVVLLCSILLWAGAGCVEDGRRNAPPLIADFPQTMVGVWETEESGGTPQKWGIKFEEDGSVKKIVHFLAGPVNLSEGGKHIAGETEDDYATFFISPCEVKYDPVTEKLEVDVIVEHYIIQKPEFKLEGEVRSNFRGKVSSNGKVWKAELRTFGRIDGAVNPTEEYIESHPDEATFYKVDLEKELEQAVD
jgi:hypothetical protein